MIVNNVFSNHLKVSAAWFLGTMLLLVSNATEAKAIFYGVGSVGYVSNEMESSEFDVSFNSVSYKLNVGYELSKNWSLELGYQTLGEDILDANELTLNTPNKEMNALFVSAIGRAGNRSGELFYRIGMLRADMSESYMTQTPTCVNGGSAVGTQGSALLCQESKSKIAGVVGLGFDFYVHHSTMLRLEIEHIRGQDKYSANAIYLGFRLNF